MNHSMIITMGLVLALLPSAWAAGSETLALESLELSVPYPEGYVEVVPVRW